ncbi:hypothetical protein BKA62DRAFT_111885 [Auriculariales sp. MPI-PUGE-AT-0066]|nr:hypothetical protein BKA62DRAFT_111885 [Auriculariales sp. MPI-PUGE-AT-0066]
MLHAEKRKSDQLEQPVDKAMCEGSSSKRLKLSNDAVLHDSTNGDTSNMTTAVLVDGVPAAGALAKVGSEPVVARWQDVALNVEEPIFDDCNDIRRKIRLIMATPDFELGAWLSDIGGVAEQDMRLFLGEIGSDGGQSNPTFRAGWLYFEKVRLLENRPKTVKRLTAEERHKQPQDTLMIEA